MARESMLADDVEALMGNGFADAVKDAAVAGNVYEYACHEGNYGLSGILSGGRADDKRAIAAVATTPAQPTPPKAAAAKKN